MARKKLESNSTVEDALKQMAEGNPGAMTVLNDVKNDRANPWAFLRVLSLDDMNIRGTQIWIGFKDYCREDKELFWELVQTGDAGLIEAINRESAKQGTKYKAVPSGASYKDPEKIVFTEDEMKELAQKPRMVHPKVKDKAPKF